eukprot:11409744-Karenia_brevis.AAC.1
MSGQVCPKDIVTIAQEEPKAVAQEPTVYGNPTIPQGYRDDAVHEWSSVSKGHSDHCAGGAKGKWGSDVDDVGGVEDGRSGVFKGHRDHCAGGAKGNNSGGNIQ